jgi:hypothetical protein
MESVAESEKCLAKIFFLTKSSPSRRASNEGAPHGDDIDVELED